ncbi:MAG: hypothetical protein AB7J13_00715, partial [Pyrinomonadaceae bacterium]
SPGQSRFTQVDPIGMASASLGNPQSNNLYAYVQNMPTDFVDPSGLNAPGSTCYITIYYTDENGTHAVSFSGRRDQYGNCLITEQQTVQVYGGSSFFPFWSQSRPTNPMNPSNYDGSGGRGGASVNCGGSTIGSTIDAAGGVGTGLGSSDASFRLSRLQGTQFSPKVYSNGWRGGSAGRITTYSVRGVGSGVASGATVMSGALAAYDVADTYSTEGRFGPQTGVAVGRGVGGVAGAYGGAKIGAAAGAGIGAFFFGGGAVPGGVIGGITGGLLGGWGGSHVGGETARGLADRGRVRSTNCR